jgi:hypothetical protein
MYRTPKRKRRRVEEEEVVVVVVATKATAPALGALVAPLRQRQRQWSKR